MTETKTKKPRKKEKKEIKEKKPFSKKETIKKKSGKVKKAVGLKKTKPKPEKYYQSVGRRKTAIARVWLWTKGEKNIFINEKLLKDYFPFFELQEIVTSPLKIMNCLNKFKISILVKGGGYRAQAEAIRHGIARALVLFNSNFRARLKRVGFLTRDSRVKERKKFGLKRARRAPQWQKR